MFLDEKVQETPGENNLGPSQKQKNHFSEFTYWKEGHISQNVDYKSDEENGLSQVLEDDEYHTGALSDEN